MLIKFLSWNINSFRGLGMDIFKKEKYTARERLESIKKTLNYFIDKKQVSVLALQELEDAIVPDIESYLNSKGLITLRNKYNPDNLSLNFLFCYDPKLFECHQQEQIYLTESGNAYPKDSSLTKEEIKKHNLDNDFVRSAQKITLSGENGETIIFINTHFGLTNSHKLLAAKKLCNELENEVAPLIILGDFNQFDKNKYNALFDEQIEIFTHNGFSWVSECLNSQNPGATFLPYPYDIIHLLSDESRNHYNTLIKQLVEIKKSSVVSEIEEQFQLIHNYLLSELKLLQSRGKSLLDVAYDGVFSRNISYSFKCKACFFEKGERIKPMPSRDEINERAIKLYAEEEECPYPSDHLPVYTKVTFSK